MVGLEAEGGGRGGAGGGGGGWALILLNYFNWVDNTNRPLALRGHVNNALNFMMMQRTARI